MRDGPCDTCCHRDGLCQALCRGAALQYFAQHSGMQRRPPLDTLDLLLVCDCAQLLFELVCTVTVVVIALLHQVALARCAPRARARRPRSFCTGGRTGAAAATAVCGGRAGSRRNCPFAALLRAEIVRAGRLDTRRMFGLLVTYSKRLFWLHATANG